MEKNPLVNAGDIRDLGSIPGSGRSPVGGHSNPLQYSCLENPMDRGAWQAMVHRVKRVRYNGSNLAHNVYAHFLLSAEFANSANFLCIFFKKISQINLAGK